MAAGLHLLRVGEFRGAAHALPTLLRPAAAFGGAGADKIALDTGVSSDHEPCSYGPRCCRRETGFLGGDRREHCNMSRGRLASRSSGVTITAVAGYADRFANTCKPHAMSELLTRTGLDWTRKYPPIAAGVPSLAARQAYLDDELVRRLPRRHAEANE
jgi:hypothetical protein